METEDLIYETEKVTRLIIEKDVDYKAVNNSNNVNFGVKSIVLSRNESVNSEGFSYYKLRDLSNTKRLRILLRESDEEREVMLPEEMLVRMTQYLQRENSLQSPFDCASFAHYANGIPYVFSHFDPSFWNVEAFAESSMKPGDTVAIHNGGDRLEDITHFAIYLGDGLYISKFGTAGRLIVSNIDEMKKGFAGEDVVKVSPKVESSA